MHEIGNASINNKPDHPVFLLNKEEANLSFNSASEGNDSNVKESFGKIKS